MKVLVAASDSDLRAQLRDVLSSRGHDVLTCRTGEAAFTTWEESNPPLVIIDRDLADGLGDAQGDALCRQLRAAPGGDAVTIFVLTETMDPGDLIAAIEAGANDYLSKPVQPALLNVRLIVAERQVAETTERKRVEAALRTQALYDGLTGLPNRVLLLDRLQQSILAARRSNQPLALFIMDLDRFKEVNDTLGHHAGDLLLQQVGARLNGLLRASDTVARLGGDEFAVLLPIAYQHGAALAARRIVRALEQPFVCSGVSRRVA